MQFWKKIRISKLNEVIPGIFIDSPISVWVICNGFIYNSVGIKMPFGPDVI